MCSALKASTYTRSDGYFVMIRSLVRRFGSFVQTMSAPPPFQRVDYSIDSDDDEQVDDDEPICKLERITPLELAETIHEITQRALELIRECKARWATELGRTTPMAPTSRLKLEQDWMLHFNNLNIQLLGGDLSPSDIVFEAICWSMWCEEPPIAASFTIQWLAETNAEMVVWSCQHTEQSRVAWPTDEEFASLRKRISGVVVQAMLLGDRSVLTNDLLTEKIQFKTLSMDLSKAYQERKLPGVLLSRKAVDLAKRKAEAIKELMARGEDTSKVDQEVVDIEAGEEYAGALWRNHAGDLVHNYVQFASRFTYKILFDNTMAARFKAPEGSVPMRFKRPVELGVCEWLRNKCRMEQPSELTEMFRVLAGESFWPLGSDTAKYRLRETKDDAVTSQTLLQNEIGIDLTQMLFDDGLVKPSVVASDTKSPYWDWMLLTMVHFALVQSVRVKWLDEYVILHPHTHASHRRMLKSQRFGQLNQCPVLVRLQRKWWVFQKQKLLPTTGTVNAFVTWWYKVQQRKPVELDNGEDVEKMASVFVPPNPLQ